MLTVTEILSIASELGVRVHDLLRPNSPVYKERHEQLLLMEEGELAAVIAGEPTLIKRPIIKTSRGIVVGLDQEKIAALLQG